MENTCWICGTKFLNETRTGYECRICDHIYNENDEIHNNSSLGSELDGLFAKRDGLIASGSSQESIDEVSYEINLAVDEQVDSVEYQSRVPTFFTKY